MIGIELPISTVDFSIYTEDASFSMFSGQYFQMLSQRLPIMLYQHVIEDEGYAHDVFMGRFYVQEWKNTGKYVYHCTGIDLIGLLDATTFDGQFFQLETTLKVAANTILGATGIAPYIEPSIEGKLIKGWIAPGSYRDWET